MSIDPHTLHRLLAQFESEQGPSVHASRFVNEMFPLNGMGHNALHGGSRQPKKYNIVLVDPPWPYNSRRMVQDNGRNAVGIDDEYSTMSMDEMKALPILNACADDCLLYMWATGPKLKEAFDLMEAWQFKYSTMAFVWDKKIPNPGFYSMSQVEYVLVGKRGRAPNPRLYNTRQLLTLARTSHSTKPEDIQDRIDAHWEKKGVRKLELFARRYRKGWDCVGNELNGTIQDFLDGKSMKLRS